MHITEDLEELKLNNCISNSIFVVDSTLYSHTLSSLENWSTSPSACTLTIEMSVRLILSSSDLHFVCFYRLTLYQPSFE